MWWIAPVALAVAAIVALLLPVRLRFYAGNETGAELRFLLWKKQLFTESPKKKKKKPPQKEKPKKTAKKTREMTAQTAIDMIRSAAEAIGKLLSEVRRRAKITLKKLYVAIGTDEAAKTAVFYGAAANACDELLEILRRNAKFREKKGAVSIFADFTAETTVAELDIVLSSSVIGVFGVILPTLNKLLENKNNK